MGVPQHRPCPRGGQSPPRHPDIQALKSCSFPCCSHSPIFLFYLHCHLLALISSLAWGKLPKLDYRKVRARTPLPAAEPALALGVLQAELERRRWGRAPAVLGCDLPSDQGLGTCVSLQGKHPRDVSNPSSSWSLGCCQQPFKPGLFQPRETRFSSSLITPHNLPLSLYFASLYFFFDLQHFRICCCSSRVPLSARGEQAPAAGPIQPVVPHPDSLPCKPQLLEAGMVTPCGDLPWCCAWGHLWGFLVSVHSRICEILGVTRQVGAGRRRQEQAGTRRKRQEQPGRGRSSQAASSHLALMALGAGSSPACHTSGTAELRHVVAQLGSIGE